MQPAQQPRQTALDLLRLVSALMVLLFHYGFRMVISGEGGGTGFPELHSVAIWADTGLLVFFGISGYVIAMSAEGRSAFDFAVGRFARLWPAFVVCATITAAVMVVWPIPGVPQPTVTQWLAQFVIISRLVGQPFMDGAYWTIAYEIIFYAWVGILIAVGLFDRAWRIAVLVWLAISIANESMIGSGALRKLFITEYSGYFAFGVVLFKSRTQFDYRAGALLALALLWATLARFVGEPGFTAMYGFTRGPVGLALVGPVALGLVTAAAFIRVVPIPTKIAVGLGTLTYPLYLLHQHIGYAVFARFGNDENRWLVGGLLVFGLLATSWLIATYIEPPMRRLITKSAARLKNIAGSRLISPATTS